MTAFAVAQGRRRALALMRDACVIGDAAEDTTNPVTGVTTVGAITAVYTGRCRIRPAGLVSSGEGSSREVTVERFPYTVSIPMDVTGLSAGLRVDITASVDDPSLVGIRLSVEQIERGTDITARRLGCVEVNR